MRYLLLLLPFCLSAQSDSTRIDDDYRFADGVFFTHQSLLSDRPDVGWENIDGEMVQLAEAQRVQIDDFGYKSGAYQLPYAISLDGIPYLFVSRNEKRGYHEFAALRNRGAFATLRYDTLVKSRLLMTAYNPANGLAFREGYVERDRRESLYRILDLRTGERMPLTLNNVRRLVATERDLLAALDRTGGAEMDKLARALTIYNSRYPLRVGAVQANR